jgi:epoxyqueuosine reductase
MAFMNPEQHSEIVLELAADAGFARAGIAAAGPVERADYVRDWLRLGRAGEMHYLHRHAELREDPRRLLDKARSVIVLADMYRQPGSPPSAPNGKSDVPTSENIAAQRGRVAQYAWGRDYHRVLRRKLQRLADRLHEAVEIPFESRVCVDTAPIIEREAAARASIGWIGKNTMILHQDLGSFFFLGEIITTLELAPSAPAVDHCGTCTRCLDACPTDAFPAPYQMDATRCISYLTIEHRTEIDERLQPLMGDWVFGCDICQDVCPFNRDTPVATETAYATAERFPLAPHPKLDDLENLTEDDYAQSLAGSAMKRAKLNMLQRNARIARRNIESFY